MKFFLLLVLLFAIFTNESSLGNEETAKNDSEQSLAYQDDNSAEKSNKDTTSNSNEQLSIVESTFEIDKYFRKIMPTIELTYGINSLSTEDDSFDGDFGNQPDLEIKIGTIYKDINTYGSQDLVDYSFTYFLVSNVSNDYGKMDEDKFQASAWKFGCGSQSGMGYNLYENSDIVFYRGDSWQWTMIEFEDDSLGSLNNTYEDAFRFGTSFEGGFKWFALENLAIGASYENSIVFPRTMFWYWAGSSVVYHIGDAVVYQFIRAVRNASPAAAPIVYFILKNAYSYGFYSLRAKSMNWPVESAPPFIFEQFKINLTFAF
jgi:hypothetical protein